MKERPSKKYKTVAEWIDGEWLTLQPFLKEAEERGRQINAARRMAETGVPVLKSSS
jgi:hypothetical protein